jgi:hypothetical protein
LFSKGLKHVRQGVTENQNKKEYTFGMKSTCLGAKAQPKNGPFTFSRFPDLGLKILAHYFLQK